MDLKMVPKKPITQQIAAHEEGIPVQLKKQSIKLNECLFANTGEPFQCFLQHYHTKNPKTLDYTSVMLPIHSSRNICLLSQPQIAWSCTLRAERGSNRYKDFTFLFLAKHLNYNLCIPHQRLIMRWL